MNETKILFISRAYPPVVGGIENQNYELGKWLGEIANLKLLANTKGKSFLPVFLPHAMFRVIFCMQKYDVLLLGDGVLGIIGWISKLFHPSKPVICVVHGLDLTFTNKFYQKLWVGFFLKKLDTLIAVGNETIRVGVERGLSKKKFVFIPNGVDTEKHLVKSSKSELEKILGISLQNKHVLLTSGRLAKRKGVAWFVKNVMPKLSADFIYVVSGNGPDKENILNAMKENKLEEKILMLGYITNEVRNVLLCNCDLFVQPNIQVAGDMEGFGISVIEAGACRLPVLASHLEGLKDAIKHEQNGFFIEPENATAYAEKINELFADKAALKLFGEKARQFVIENYSWHTIAEKYLAQIQKTIYKK